MKRPHALIFFKDEKKEHRWRLVAPNGKIVANSGEGYKKIRGAKTGALSAMRGFTNYKIYE